MRVDTLQPDISDQCVKCFKQQRGVALIMTSILLIVIFLLLALVIDLGRLFIMARQMQNTVDSAALSGASALRKLNADDPQSVPLYNSTTGGWKQVKPRIRFALSQLVMKNAQAFPSSTTFSFDTPGGSLDDSGFQGRTAKVGSGQTGAVTITVDRGVGCFVGGTGAKFFKSIEYTPTAYCISNAVRVSMAVERIPFFFAQFVGVAEHSNLQRQGAAYIAKPITCGDPNCDTYFNYNGLPNDPDSWTVLGSIVCP